MIIECLSKGEVPDEFENLSENSKINRLNRLKMIVEYRLNEQDNNEEKNYEKALEVILNQFENIK